MLGQRDVKSSGDGCRKLGSISASRMELRGGQRLWQDYSTKKVPSRGLRGLFQAARKLLCFLLGSSIPFVFSRRSQQAGWRKNQAESTREEVKRPHKMERAMETQTSELWKQETEREREREDSFIERLQSAYLRAVSREGGVLSPGLEHQGMDR